MRTLILVLLVSWALAYVPFDPPVHPPKKEPMWRTYNAPRLSATTFSTAHCEACQMAGGTFAHHGTSIGCFYGTVPRAWHAVWDCAAYGSGDCVPLADDPKVMPSPVCWDLTGDDDDADASLVVIWGYRIGVGGTDVEIARHSCYNHFEPSSAGSQPELFTKHLFRHPAFVAVTPRGECQTWFLGNHSSTVCTETAEAEGVRRCTQARWSSQEEEEGGSETSWAKAGAAGVEAKARSWAKETVRATATRTETVTRYTPPSAATSAAAASSLCSMVHTPETCSMIPLCSWCDGACRSTCRHPSVVRCVMHPDETACAEDEDCHWCTGPIPMCYVKGICPVVEKNNTSK